MHRRLAILGCLALAACSTTNVSSREMPVGAPIYTLVAVEVDVPRTLSVSEANRFYPLADIVWRGEPVGDRHEQVAAIFRDGAGIAATSLTEGRPVIAHIEVERFHSVTEKALHHVGGDHDMRFRLRLHDASTGASITDATSVHTTLSAFGGSSAVLAAQRGETMRSRVVEHVGRTLVQEMSQPAELVTVTGAQGEVPTTAATARASF